MQNGFVKSAYDQKGMTGARIVCVLGMHRSGTSVLARLLNILGVNLGPEASLLQSGTDNPKGFWEHAQIKRINDEILGMAGGSWHDPPELPYGWECCAEFEGLRIRAKQILHNDFGKSPVWGWKDPRTCLTLPFWQVLLPRLNYVICLRHPMDVARSLEQRNGFSIEKGVYLWLLYFKAALLSTSKEHPLVIIYEELIRNTQLELEQIVKYLGIAQLFGQRNLLDMAAAFVDKDLRHHSSRLSDSIQTSDTARVSRALTIADNIYNHFYLRIPIKKCNVIEQIEHAIGILRSVVSAQNTEKRLQEEQQWKRNTKNLIRFIERTIPKAQKFILVDDAQLELKNEITGCRIVPFLERGGLYCGIPDNDDMAIKELERLQREGVRHIVFAWPAFWWLEHYTKLYQYLRTRCHCLLVNDSLMIFKFDLD